MRTAIYARKSTLKDGQKDTIENQIKICRRRAKDLGLTIVDIKKDSASGVTDNNRDEVKDLIKGAVEGNYECVIMKGISRLYRDVEQGIGLLKKLDRSNIRVITVEENFDSYERRTGNGQLDISMITMYLMFAENESKKLADRIKHTQIEKAHAGEWNQASSVPFGYAYDPLTKKLKIDHYKTDVVKLIFNLYFDGMGMKTIAAYLNGDNPDGSTYPSPRGARWSQYTIGFILKNQVYVGDIVYNKRSKTSRPYKNPEAIGKNEDDVYHGNDYNEVKEWIIVKDAHPAIIDREVFNQIQSIMNTKAIRTGVRNNISLLASVAKCGKCGTGMTFKRGNRDKQGRIKTKSNYYCSNYIKYGKRYCTSHHIGALEFETAIIEHLQNEIDTRLNYDDVVSSLKGQSKSDPISENIKRVTRDIDQLVRKTDMLLEKNLEGSLSDAQFRNMNQKYLDETERLTKKLEELKIAQLDEKTDKTTKEYLLKKYEEVKDIKGYPLERQRYIILECINKITFNEGDVKIEYNF